MLTILIFRFSGSPFRQQSCDDGGMPVRGDSAERCSTVLILRLDDGALREQLREGGSMSINGGALRRQLRWGPKPAPCFGHHASPNGEKKDSSKNSSSHKQDSRNLTRRRRYSSSHRNCNATSYRARSPQITAMAATSTMLLTFTLRDRNSYAPS